MSGNSPYAPVDSDVSPALLPLAAQQAVSVSTSVSTSASGWTTGDYKISAQAADHADVGGGRWLICDATAIDATYADLIALVGATRPDARGRTLVMKGTNADVSTLLANDGQAVANRRPKHRTTNSLAISDGSSATAFLGNVNSGTNNDPLPAGAGWGMTSIFLSGSIGTNNANDALDTPSYLVPGNLFIHT